MIFLNFEKWDNAGGRIFKKQRIYRKGYIWTPFIKLSIRYNPWHRDITPMRPSEAIYEFCGWLTTREEKTIMSSSDECSPVADRIQEFSDYYGLKDPRKGWPDKTKPGGIDREDSMPHVFKQ